MKKIIVLFSILFVFQTAQAREFGAVFGFNYTEAQSTTTNVSSDSEVGFQAGVQYYHPLKSLNDKLYFRTGGVITQRVSEFGIFEFDLLYLDIPATLEYRINEMVGLFSGLQLGLLMADECTPGCNVQDPNSFILGFPLGVSVMINPEMGFDFYYQIGLTDMWQNSEWSDTLGAQFIYKFDI